MLARNALVYTGMSAEELLVTTGTTLQGGLQSADTVTVASGGLTVSTGGATVVSRCECAG
jgi:hypothetical protein